ncbi:hypothetical protein D3C76_1014840 [compost metagenome]
MKEGLSLSEHDDIERHISELLTEGVMQNQEDLKDQEIRLIPPKYEIRIQTTLDPIVEETRRYRKIATEIDDRYDSYMEKSDQAKAKKS